MFSYFLDRLRLDVLIRPARDVVDNGWSEVHELVNVVHETLHARLAVVRVDLETPVHSSLEAHLGHLESLSSVETTCVSDDGELVTPLFSRKRDGPHLLILFHEMAFSRSACDYESLNTMFNLVLDMPLEGW